MLAVLAPALADDKWADLNSYAWPEADRLPRFAAFLLEKVFADRVQVLARLVAAIRDDAEMVQTYLLSDAEQRRRAEVQRNDRGFVRTTLSGSAGPAWVSGSSLQKRYLQVFGPALTVCCLVAMTSKKGGHD